MLTKPNYEPVGVIYGAGQFMNDDGAVKGAFQTRTELFVCSACRAVVVDTEGHSRWHTVAQIGMG